MLTSSLVLLQQTEILRWQAHNSQIVPQLRAHMRDGMSNQLWWKECGAYVCMIPRQTGKTTIIKAITDGLHQNNEDFLVLTSSLNYARNLIRDKGLSNTDSAHSFIKNKLNGMHTQDTHLFIDEYQRLQKSELNTLLNQDWRSVSLFGTLL